MTGVSQADIKALSLRYAVAAADIGWSQAAFHEFMDAQGVSTDMQLTLWPHGARSAARIMNTLADDEMNRRWATASNARLADIVQQRFADNRPLKRSVARLALSDLVHPLDTLARTAQTADHMLVCRGGYRATGVMARWCERWALVMAYSACVLVWLADKTPNEGLTRGAIHHLLAFIGAR
jgi:hypothetical protein